MTVYLVKGDSLSALPRMAREGLRAHSCVTDPPYHLTSIVKRFGGKNAAPARHGTDGAFARASSGFMGQTWDGGDVAFRPETWAAVMECLLPGAHLVAFGGTRTWHRMAVAIEDAGFEIRDNLAWLYGTGFPKSHNQDGDWKGWGTALKPGFEPIILARKPLIGTVARNLAAHGAGALHIGACRVPGITDEPNARKAKQAQTSPGYEGGFGLQERAWRGSIGRWPANVLHDGSDEVEAAFAAFGQRPGQSGSVRDAQRTQANVYGATSDAGKEYAPRGDTGTASRFFYCAKASKADRSGSKHPTVKPTALMSWLVQLVTPPGGMVLDPFAGSGSTGLAARQLGMSAVLVEREAAYAQDIERKAGVDETFDYQENRTDAA